MSKKICRTCLKMTYKTYKTHENIHYPGETEQLKISDMLRYLIPELYLGVTVTPEICEECKTTLRSAYAFRKKCLATENLIGSYLKKSRCNASSIELIDVIIFLEQKRKTESQDQVQTNENIQVKAQDIISEWDDDASQDSPESNILPVKKENSQNPPQVQKELTLSPELGVFVDKYGNYYNADGISIDLPEPIINTQTDFFKITNVFSVSEEGEILPKHQKTKTPEEQSNVSDKKTPVIRVIPEAKASFTKPRIKVIAEAKTDLMKRRVSKMIKVKKNVKTPRISIIPDAKSEVKIPATPESKGIPEEVRSEPVEPILPIIVDVRSESESTDQCSPCVNSESHSNNVQPNSDVKPNIKEEPMEHYNKDDETTLSGSESNSNYDNIQGLIDKIPDDNYYVDVPEFVHINNFSLKDLNELRQKQQSLQTVNVSVLDRVGKESQPELVDPLLSNTRTSKPLLKLLPKSDSQSNQNIADQLIALEKNQQQRLKSIQGEETQGISSTLPSLEFLSTNKVFGKKLPSIKKCVVPKCPNNSDLNPKKLFILLPKKEVKRAPWFSAIGIQPLSSFEVYVCEDHFDLPIDMENWIQFKVFGGRMKMKEDIIPHKYINEPIPEEMIYKSQLGDADRKRRAEQLERLEKTKVPRLEPLDDPLTSEVQNKTPASSEVQRLDDDACPYNQPNDDVDPSIELESDQTSLESKPHPTLIDGFRSHMNGDKSIPRIIRKRGRRIKIVPIEDKEEEKKFRLNADNVCVLFTNYTSDGLYVNDHDYLVTPYKRNKILLIENNEWLCMCFICGWKHPVDDHITHMSLHTSVCSVCKANLGTAFMLNMHVRFHTKKCVYCTQKVLYRDIAKHELMHLKEDAEFEKDKEKKSHWRGKKIVGKDESPVNFPIKIGSDSDREEIIEPSPTRRLRTISTKQSDDITKNTVTIQNSEQQSTVEIPESIQNNIEDIGKPNQAPREPQKTETTPDKTDLVSDEIGNNESVEDNTKQTLKEEPKRITRRSAVTDESSSPMTNDELKKTRNLRSRRRDVEHVKIEEKCPRVLRSRQKKDYKEEPESSVKEKDTSP